MREYQKLCLLLIATFLSVGCSVGNGRLCGPQTPSAYCDQEAYLKLMYPKPYLQYWMKDGISPEARRSDSENCGAMASNLQDEPDRYPIFSQKDYQAQQRPAEEKFITEKRLIAEWQRCMLAKGYSVSEEWILLIDKF